MKHPEDNSLDGLLRRSLARERPTDECPGADLLAAYSERSLDPHEISHWEEHFSQCSSCREQLAAIVRSSAEVEVPQGVAPMMAASAALEPVEQLKYEGAGRSATRGGSHAAREKAAPRVVRWWWLAPVAATILLAALLYVRHRSSEVSALVASRQTAMTQSERGFTDEGKSASVENRAAAKRPPASTIADNELEKRYDNNSKDKKSAVENLPLVARNYEQPAPPTMPAPAKPDAAAGSGADSGAGRVASDSAQKNAARGQRYELPHGLVRGAAGAAGAAMGGAVATPPPAGESAPANAPPPTAHSQEVEVQQQATDLDQLQQQSERQRIQQQQALTPQDQKVGEANARSATNTVTVTAAANVISTLIAVPTPDRQVIYRIVGAGFVERTTDGGATWQGQQVSPSADFTAGSAPTPKICWLVGRAGVVFRTTDGSNWKKISPPASVDLAAVSAADASTATVTAVSGQKYSTENAGKNWVASR